MLQIARPRSNITIATMRKSPCAASLDRRLEPPSVPALRRRQGQRGSSAPSPQDARRLPNPQARDAAFGRGNSRLSSAPRPARVRHRHKLQRRPECIEFEGLTGCGGSLVRTSLYVAIPCYPGKYRENIGQLGIGALSDGGLAHDISRLAPNSLPLGTGNFAPCCRERERPQQRMVESCRGRVLPARTDALDRRP